MALGIIALVGFLAAILLFITRRIYTWNRLRHIPGPLLSGWTRAWFLRLYLRCHALTELEKISQKYGPIARISPTHILVSSPSEIRRIWSVHSGYRRSPWYRAYRIDPSSDSILTLDHNKQHHALRAQLLPAYAGRGLPSQEPLIDTQLLALITLIQTRYLSTPSCPPRPFEMGRGFQYFTQDSISAVEFGRPWGYLQSDSDSHGVIEALESTQLPCGILSMFPEFLPLLSSRLITPFLPKPTDTTGLGKLLGLIHDRVSTRYTEKPDNTTKNDVLDAFISTTLTPSQIEAEALVHLLGGSDTTATAIRCAVFYLATHPNAYALLQSEIDASLPSVARPVISGTQASSLPYLQAVIRETLRMWPPISGLAPKVSDTDDVICGKRVPAGTHVCWSTRAIMRDTKVFGEDAQVFRPGRWIDAAQDTERLREMEATQGLVFAGGSRWECLGRRLAGLEMGKVLFELFARFDFAMTDPVKPFEWINYGFTMHEHMNVTITERVKS